MKPIYRLLYELFSWLGWVTGFELFIALACNFYLRAAHVFHVNGKTILSNVYLNDQILDSFDKVSSEQE